MARKPEVTNLESSLESLESLVERMESGELSLEESLKAFEEGVRLTRQSEEAEPEPFESPDESDADEG